MKMKIKNIILGMILVGILSGCVGKEVLPVSYYQLEIPYKKTECKSVQTYNWLGVEVAEKINTKKIAYREASNEVAYFAKNQWIESLPNMLDSLMLKAAYQSCIDLVESRNPLRDSLKLYVLDFSYDESSNRVFFEAKLQKSAKDSKTLWIYRDEVVPEGDFKEIIKTMNAVILDGYFEAFSQI
ncbi:MAG: ABC-type transport auxiliary lipoprotein family protein [Helicobacter sp.]|uniref:ABC-type transport auxiliary lipoprotein family protein n=1 Tax=Helicobacter TaxID=209 RepID=UPI002029D4F6|nr:MULTISPECIES: ABC-type transport auxiliary lipoprotein family protein [Helicobacter]MCI7766281.1 ABC-type transport auxiliary lipoprotein family protein [Helicobacter sp.]MCL9823325.1 ABC-type transport auxiliary lipoprotein family protein [Helicobacter colisuis]MDY4426988.1 ABC-type transport auxiliary lipoprotein family protein [Helicobacter sp.]